MGALIRALDWSKTPIGPIESWSPALKMMVRFLLANRFPMLLWWGPHYISIYNDPYRPVLGAKHPWALGKPVSECWSEIWHVLKPLIDTPFQGGTATWNDDIQLEINRHGFLEETHFTVAYSAVPDDTLPSGIGGVLATVHEISEKVVAERRVVALRDLGAVAGQAKTAEEACAVAASALGAHAKDVPFALLYLLEADGASARLVGTAGIEPGADMSPLQVDLRGAASPWPFAEVLREDGLQLVTPLAERFREVPRGPWSDPPSSALVLSIPSNRAHQPCGVLVAGVSARLRLDQYYKDFLELIRARVATAIANARAYDEERKRAEALASLDRAKTAFFSNVSHEFRTPLTLMLGPTEDLLSGVHGQLTKEQRAQLEMLRRNELRLQRLVNALLEFSRLEAGRIRAVFEPVDLGLLTREIAASFRSAIERAGLRFSVACEVSPCEAEAARVYVDRNMWEHVVLNLLSNAFKFTFEGEIEVSLGVSRERAVLRVRDTGVGVRAEDLPRLFDRFHRVEGTRARTHEGSGIGLALVQELVRIHAGSISVESKYGTGTCFSVTLPTGSGHLPPERILNGSPAAQRRSAGLGAAAFVEEALLWLPSEEASGSCREPAPRTEEARAPQSSRHPSVAPSAAARERILIADDNADMRAYLRRIVEERWLVDTVSHGEAAIASARARRPDLIVSDVMMPVLDGFGLLRKLRADPSTASIPLILLSARVGEDARVDGLQAGADDYLVKPFSARELVARIETHLKLARAQAAAERRSAEARQQAQESETQLRQAVAIRDEFLTVASHELRTPLTTIGFQTDGLLHLLRRAGPSDATAERCLPRAEKLRAQIDRLESLIEEVLDVFSLGGQQIEITREPVDLAQVARGCVEALRKSSKQAHAAISLEAEPTWGEWDRRRIEQILKHLILNALKFGAGKPVEVAVGAGEDMAQISVKDLGIGIAPEDHERIFGRFVRIAPATQYAGFGMGLWIVRELAQAMRGSVHVESALGAGATFSVQLPRHP